jgi:thioredoxin 1
MSVEPGDEGWLATRVEIERMQGPVLLEFGARWCGHCRALAPGLARLLEGHPEIQHVKVEDKQGMRLGRSFRVTVWPTLVFLKDGQVVKQLARPNLREIQEGLDAIDGD